MILFVDNNPGILFLSHEEIIIEHPIIEGGGFGGVTPQKAKEKLPELESIEQLAIEDDEVLLIIQIFMSTWH